MQSYQDRNYILLGTLFITFTMTLVGTDHSLEELLSPILLKKLCYNTVLIGVAWLGIRAIIIFFDKRMPWKQGKNGRRWTLQIITTFAFTSLISLVSLCVRTFFIPEWKVFPKTIWLTDYPLSLLFTLGFSFLYYHWWSRRAATALREVTIHPLQKEPIIENIEAATTIAVKKGRKVLLLSPQDISYAFRLDDFNYIVTQAGEKHLLDSSLNILEKELASHGFFRLNRQLLAHRTAIKSFQILPNRHLQVVLQPELAGNLLVNKNKAASFKQWMNS